MRRICLVFLMLCILMNLYAEEINLYNDDMDIVSKFEELNMEEQYRSYIKSFRYVGDTKNRQLYWARYISQYGRDVLPLIDEDIKNSNFNHLFRKPYDDVLGLISYIFYEMNRKKLLTQEDKSKYKELYEKKIEDYVLEFRIIDGTVSCGIICIEFFTERPEYLPYDVKQLKKYYEEKLGITDIGEGNLRSNWQ